MNTMAIAGRHLRIMLLVIFALVAGCAREVKNVTLTPPAPVPSTTLRSQSILLRNVTDERGSEKPVESSQVAGAEDENEAEETLPLADAPRAIGQGPAGPGREAGEILLATGQTVESVIRQTLENTFRGMGYAIETDEGNISSNDMIVDVTIDRFWGSEAPGRGKLLAGAGGVSVTGGIATTLKISGPIGKKQTRQIAVRTRRRVTNGLVTRDWRLFFQSLLDDYAAAARKELKDLPQP